MKKVSIFCISLLLVPVFGNAQERVGDFSLIDQQGYHHGMSWYDDHAAIALLVQANGSDTVARAIDDFDSLKSDYDSQGIEFMMINPMGNLNREAVKVQVGKYGVDIPVLMDDARVISEALGISQVGEVLLFDPKKFTVLYKGPVSSLSLIHI